MPLESWPHSHQTTPDDRTPVWRYFRLKYFADLMKTGELHFSRCDLFDDEAEGLPTDDYIRWVCAHEPLGDFDYVKGMLAQDREACFASCWHNFDTELARMWARYGRDGVAVISQFGKLKDALGHLPDRTMVGSVNYNEEYFGFNVLRFVTTKRLKFQWEREIRALIWIPEWAGQSPP